MSLYSPFLHFGLPRVTEFSVSQFDLSPCETKLCKRYGLITTKGVAVDVSPTDDATLQRTISLHRNEYQKMFVRSIGHELARRHRQEQEKWATTAVRILSNTNLPQELQDKIAEYVATSSATRGIKIDATTGKVQDFVHGNEHYATVTRYGGNERYAAVPKYKGNTVDYAIAAFAPKLLSLAFLASKTPGVLDDTEKRTIKTVLDTMLGTVTRTLRQSTIIALSGGFPALVNVSGSVIPPRIREHALQVYNLTLTIEVPRQCIAIYPKDLYRAQSFLPRVKTGLPLLQSLRICVTTSADGEAPQNWSVQLIPRVGVTPTILSTFEGELRKLLTNLRQVDVKKRYLCLEVARKTDVFDESGCLDMREKDGAEIVPLVLGPDRIFARV